MIEGCDYTRKTQFKVTRDSMRPASEGEECCFYCAEPLGSNHLSTCVLVRKKVKVRFSIEYEVAVPSFWSGADVDFHRNDSSWCKSNVIEELRDMIHSGDDCLCYKSLFEYLSDVGEPFLEETGRKK